MTLLTLIYNINAFKRPAGTILYRDLHTFILSMRLFKYP